jgi:uncharacterized iron-regulated membrane protein
VVGATGVINTLAEVMLSQWKATELADMVKPYAGKPPPVHLASLDATLERARNTAPGMIVSFVAFPGTPFTSSHHFAVFMRGDTPLTSRLLKPVLLDGETGEVSDARDLPVYLKALLVSQPLHFGDYGGMPLLAFPARSTSRGRSRAALARPRSRRETATADPPGRHGAMP